MFFLYNILALSVPDCDFFLPAKKLIYSWKCLFQIFFKDNLHSRKLFCPQKNMHLPLSVKTSLSFYLQKSNLPSINIREMSLLVSIGSIATVSLLQKFSRLVAH